MTIKITGNTFAAKTVLRTAGFEFDAVNKCWIGNTEELTELKRITTATYSRSNQKAISGIVITEE